MADNTVSIGVTSGTSEAHATDIVFDSMITVEGQQYEIGRSVLVVDDMSGTAAGWTVTLGLQAQLGADVEDLVLIAVTAPTRIAGQAIDVSSGPLVPSSGPVGTLEGHRVVLTTEPGFGTGAYQQQLTLARRIPSEGANQAATATATIAVTITVPAGTESR